MNYGAGFNNNGGHRSPLLRERGLRAKTTIITAGMIICLRHDKHNGLFSTKNLLPLGTAAKI